MSRKPRSDAGRPTWRLDDAATLRRLLVILTAVALILLAGDLVVPRHGKLAVETVFGVYAALGLAGVGLIAAGGVLLRRMLSRREGYYDR